MKDKGFKISIFLAIVLVVNMVAPTQMKSAIKPLTESSPPVQFTAGVKYDLDILQQSIELKPMTKNIQRELTKVEIGIELMDIPRVSSTEKVPETPEYIPVKATAFCDSVLADGTEPMHGVLAGKREWLGRSVELYDSDYNYLGLFIFHDVGYGRSLGYGESEFYGREHMGTIEAGLTIDIWMENVGLCYDWGIKDIYMVWK